MFFIYTISDNNHYRLSNEMRYSEFKNRCQDLPLIQTRDIFRFDTQSGGKQTVFNQLNRWQERKWVVKLKRGLYLLNPNDRKIHPSRSFLANQLYSPSYISLEYALNFYGLIPEKVVDITSVTTKKTNIFKNEEGSFIYQHIKKEAYAGFRSLTDEEGLTFFMAHPEKAMVDFLYLNLSRFDSDAQNVFKESFRFQNMEILRNDKLLEYTKLFHNKKLTRLVHSLRDFITLEAAP